MDFYWWLQLILFLAALYFVQRKLLAWGRYSHYPPTAQGIWLPFFGHMFSFGSDPIAFFLGQMKKLNTDIFSFELFATDCIYMGGDEAQGVFYSAPESTLNAAEAYKFMIPAFGPGIVYDCPDKKFQEQRKFLGKNLSLGAFRRMVDIIHTESRDYLAEVWKDKGSLDFYHDVGEMAMRTSVHALQGPQIRELVPLGYAKYMEDIDHAISILSFFFPNLPLPAYRKRNLARKKIGEMIKKVLSLRRENESLQEPDFLQMLSSSTYADGTPVTDEEIAGLSVALMLAGQHTSNITTSWLGIFLLSYPEVLAEVNKELDEVWPEGTDLDLDKVQNMKYLGLCIKETLRLRPPIILIWRKVMEPFKYKNYTVPKGALVCVSPAVSGKMESLGWSNPDQFDPMRFERKEDKAFVNSYLAFSRGKHSCIGEKFAYLQIKIIWATILRNYNVTLKGSVKDYPVDPTQILAGPTPPVIFNYEAKKKVV